MCLFTEFMSKDVPGYWLDISLSKHWKQASTYCPVQQIFSSQMIARSN